MRWHTEDCMQAAAWDGPHCLPECAAKWRAFEFQLRRRKAVGERVLNNTSVRMVGALGWVMDALGIEEEVNDNS